MPVSWLRVGCAAWTCQPPTPTPPSATARSALERPPTYPHLRENSAACGGVYLPTPLGSEGKSVSLGIPLEKECSPGASPAIAVLGRSTFGLKITFRGGGIIIMNNVH